MITAALLFLVGLVAGELGALMGLGGGIFLVPLLVLAFDLPMRVAVGTSLVGVIATSAGVAAFSSRGRGGDVGLALRLEMVTTLGAIGGSLLAAVLSHRALSVIFALVVWSTAIYTSFKTRGHAGESADEELFRAEIHPRRWPAGLAGSGLAGMISGLLGVGGGFIKVPVMYAVMEVPLGVAAATSNFMVGITAAASVFIYYGRGDLYPMVVVPTAAGVFLGAMSGALLLPHLKARLIRTVLLGVLFLLGVSMLYKGLRP